MSVCQGAAIGWMDFAKSNEVCLGWHGGVTDDGGFRDGDGHGLRRQQRSVRRGINALDGKSSAS